MRNIVLLFAAALGALVGLLAPSSQAQDDPVTLERRVKAAFIYKFAGYVEWPDSAFAASDAPITIGVLGDDAMAVELVQAAGGRAIDTHPVTVRRIRDVEGAAGLHVLFVSQAERGRLAALRNAPSQPLLIITESDKALDQGSVVNFVISEGRVRFEVALDNAERRNLKLSARLLTVAQFVRMGGAP